MLTAPAFVEDQRHVPGFSHVRTPDHGSVATHTEVCGQLGEAGPSTGQPSLGRSRLRPELTREGERGDGGAGWGARGGVKARAHTLGFR